MNLAHVDQTLPAPETFHRRVERYQGAEEGTSVAGLGGDDATIVGDLYDYLGEVMKRLRPVMEDSGLGIEAVKQLLVERPWDAIVDPVSRLGLGLGKGSMPLGVKKALHDVRGGSFQGLVIHLDLIAAGYSRGTDAGRVFVLARDHRKMMRNAFPDLDPAGYEADLQPRLHGMKLLEEKWGSVDYGVGDSRARVSLEGPFAGELAERCMEYAALDRAIYNLVNNACRFTTDGAVRMAAIPRRCGGETQVRLLVCNAISAEQQGYLDAAFGTELSRIFEGGFTTGGHGIGLRVVTDVVTHGYGLASVSRALDEGYLGARVLDGSYLAWFFWPAAGEDG